MKLEKIVHAVPLAMLMQPGQLPPDFTVNRQFQVSDIHVQAPHPDNALTSDTESQVVFEPIAETVREEVVPMAFGPRASSWEKEYKERYDELVQKEALETITDHEVKELEFLHKARRRLVSPASSAEIIARHRREKLDRELKAVLQRYVRLTPFPKNRA